MNMNDKLVLIGMPSGSGFVPTAMVNSLLQLHKPCPCAFMTIERQRIDKARNIIAMEGLRNKVSHILFVDDDNPVPPDTLQKLLEDDKDIVSAPILSRNADAKGVHNLCAFYQEEHTVKKDGEDFELRIYKPITKFKDEGYLHKVDAVGTGCVLIKSEVLQKMHSKYKDSIFEFGDIRFEEQEIDGQKFDRRTMSEDCEFSERARDLGFEVWIDERIRPKHISGNTYVQYENKDKKL